MRKSCVVIITVAVFAAAVFFFQDPGKEYDISWFGLGKEGHFHISKQDKIHSIELDFDGLKPDEVYEVEVYFKENKVATIKSSQVITHTPGSRGKYVFRFYKIENGQRIKVKPKISNTKRARPGIRVSSTSSTGNVTATVDA